MLRIEAVVRNTKLHQVQDALEEVGVTTFSSYEIKLSGLHPEHSISAGRPGSFKTSSLIPKTNIVVICKEQDKEKIVSTITESARTGQKGDGLISIYKIDELIKIRNGATGESAII